MTIIWGTILLIISSIGYFGQLITALSPERAANLGLTEPETDVDPTFYADVRGEAYWDSVILWVLPVAGVLLILGHPLWPYFGLVGGGMYLYFAGRGILTRRIMQSRAIRIGSQSNLRTIYIFLTIWGITALVTIVLSAATLFSS